MTAGHGMPSDVGASAGGSTGIRVLGDPQRVRSALSPLRRRLLGELREPGSAAGLADRMGVSRQKLNYHLRKLEEQGLVRLVAERPRRGLTERILQTTARTLVVDPEVLGEIAEDPAMVQDRFSSAYMIAAAAKLLGDVAELRAGAEAADKRLLTVTEEAEICFESPRAVQEFTAELTAALARLVAEYHRSADPDSRPHRLLLAVHPRRNPAADNDDDAALRRDDEGGRKPPGCDSDRNEQKKEPSDE